MKLGYFFLFKVYVSPDEVSKSWQNAVCLFCVYNFIVNGIIELSNKSIMHFLTYLIFRLKSDLKIFLGKDCQYYNLIKANIIYIFKIWNRDG